MVQRPTIADVAREAGLGVATVDRVLNGRPGVSARAIARVTQAAERIGYHAAGLARYREESLSRPAMRLGFVLQKPGQEFYRAFAAEIERAVATRPDIRGRADIRFPRSQGVDDYLQVIAEVAKTCDVIAMVAPNQPRIAQLIGELNAAGKPVFTLLNDVAPAERLGYFGTDNIKVGRTAAWMLTTAIHMPGKLAVFVGSSRWHGHMLREAGFQSYLREHAPGFTMLDTMINLDTRQLTHEATLDLLQRHPDLRGLYVAGGGMEGAIAALRETRPPGKVALVVNELTPASRAALIDRYALMAIATPLPGLCRRTVAAMIEARSGQAGPGQVFLDADLHLPESV